MGVFSFVICAENSIIYIVHSYWNFLETWKKICFTIVRGSKYDQIVRIVAQVLML